MIGKPLQQPAKNPPSTRSEVEETLRTWRPEPPLYEADGPYPMPLAESRNDSYMLFRGMVENALDIYRHAGWRQTPNLWWPEDRQWFISTGVEADYTVIAGPAELLRDLAELEGLLLHPIGLDDDLPIPEWVNKR